MRNTCKFVASSACRSSGSKLGVKHFRYIGLCSSPSFLLTNFYALKFVSEKASLKDNWAAYITYITYVVMKCLCVSGLVSTWCVTKFSILLLWYVCGEYRTKSIRNVMMLATTTTLCKHWVLQMSCFVMPWNVDEIKSM